MSSSLNDFDNQYQLSSNIHNINNQNQSENISSISNSNMINVKPLLVLLDKAEQILSIINLPETATKKYNQLKEMVFNKCNLEYIPLISRKNNFQKENISSNRTCNSSTFPSDLSTLNQPSYSSKRNHINDNSITIAERSTIDNLKYVNKKMCLIIDFLFEFIEKKNYENIKIFKSQLKKSEKDMKSMLDEIYSYNLKNANYENDIEFDMKLYELQMNDYISKCDYYLKTFFIQNEINDNKNQFVNESSSLDKMIQNFNKKIKDLKCYQEQQILEYENKFKELKLKYKPQLENENNELKKYIKNISDIIQPVYSKYSKKKISTLNNIDLKSENTFEDDEIKKINFLIGFIEQLFQDNKHLIDTIKQFEIDREEFEKILNVPFIKNTIKNNDILKNIYDKLNNNVSSNPFDSYNIIHQDINQLIQRLSTSIKSIH